MQVFVSSSHTLHAPQWYVADGMVRPCPDHPERIERILAALQKADHEIWLLNSRRTAAAPLEPAIAAIHSADYLEYLRTIHGLWKAEFGPKVDVIPDTFPRRGRSGSTALKRPAKPAAQAGYYCFDMAAPIASCTWTAALAGAECAIRTAEAVLGGERAAYALTRPPGHHAGADYCGGFCYLNNAAIAAEHLRQAGGAGKKRVAVLDIDYHHGNGTQDIFYARRDVLFVSVHAEPDTQYPYFWGHAEERGVGEGEGFTHNFPLARGTGEKAWLETLSRALEAVARFEPEAVVVSLGVDTYEEDTVGDFGVTVEGFGRAGEMIKGLRRPTVIIQEGGYNLDAVGPCVAAYMSSYK